MNFLNMFFNRKSKHVIKGVIPEIEKKQNKLTCEQNPMESMNRKQKITNKLKHKKILYLENANFDQKKLFHKH